MIVSCLGITGQVYCFLHSADWIKLWVMLLFIYNRQISILMTSLHYVFTPADVTVCLFESKAVGDSIIAVIKTCMSPECLWSTAKFQRMPRFKRWV